TGSITFSIGFFLVGLITDGSPRVKSINHEAAKFSGRKTLNSWRLGGELSQQNGRALIGLAQWAGGQAC
ncbi:MAG: hypothetical protein WA821_15205, partial [Anaerolineales bacterium]